ncbi:pitrilysin family protein [Streptomyces glaucus]
MPIPRLQRHTLPNGLRVVIQPLTSGPTVGVSVHYGVGFRSESPSRSGFAHLFEHLMFQGSARIRRGDHFRLVQSAGGTVDGSTHQDYTVFHQVIPSNALERVLFMEADRMREPIFTMESLRTQVDVVKEEIRLNLMNKPYGGFPWTVLPSALFSDFRNAHNGYGDFAALEKVTVADCEAFFESYYAPGNAVLTVTGDIQPRQVMELVWRHFANIPSRPVPTVSDSDEPAPRGMRTGVHHDRHAPLPATAIGYRLPDPRTALHSYLAHMVLCSLLATGESSRLRRKLIGRTSMATDVSMGCGLFGALDARHPDLLLGVVVHSPGTSTDAVISVLDEELHSLVAEGPTPREVNRAVAMSAAARHRKFDSLAFRTPALGTLELLFDSAELLDQLPGALSSVDAVDVAMAAQGLSPDARAVVQLVPGAAGADE